MFWEILSLQPLVKALVKKRSNQAVKEMTYLSYLSNKPQEIVWETQRRSLMMLWCHLKVQTCFLRYPLLSASLSEASFLCALYLLVIWFCALVQECASLREIFMFLFCSTSMTFKPENSSTAVDVLGKTWWLEHWPAARFYCLDIPFQQLNECCVFFNWKSVS